ncbi:MAG: hypothetical protein JWM19_162 [Actinomycetia bacterium]|nr:hypothetical protein [Actinomycetes bacterium]
MFRNSGNSGHGAPFLFNLSFLVAFLFVCRQAVATVTDVSDRAITWARGHLGPRPDPWVEDRLRGAFAQIDRDLAAILNHEPYSR